MADGKNIPLTFAGLADDETAPRVALYAVDDLGKPVEVLARAKEGVLPIPPGRLKGRIAVGPDVEDLATLTPDRLTHYRAEQVAKIWAAEGLVLPRPRWEIFWPLFRCVSGRVRKCRPWWWDLVATPLVTASRAAKLSQTVSLQLQAQTQVSIAAAASATLLRPWRCVPLCDGIVEVYERQCCCIRVHVPDLLDRLRDVLERIPIPWPPEPDPGPLGLDLGRLAAARAPRRAMGVKTPGREPIDTGADPSFAPPERLYEAYVDLQRLPAEAAEKYALDRVWLHPFFCHCSSRKVGEVAIQPGGEFSFCYLRGPVPSNCWLTYAYKVRQRINGSWITVYDGLASGAWFAAGEEAEIRVTDHRALPCGDAPGDSPPGEGTPFVMLEHVTGAGTHHFNFPDQTGLSQVGALGTDDGLYDTGYAPDCPWATTLGLRLWISPELNGTVAFYRLSVAPVNAAGSPSGPAQVLDSPVSWSRFVFVGGEWVVQGEALGPVTQGTETGLFRAPYWAGGMNWLSGQFHQGWNTASFANGRYLLILELFDAGGGRIKPSGSPGPGTGQAFQFRRWSSDTVTENVAFADCAHVFWIDNLPVVGDIVDLRKNGVANADECQFMRGPGSDQLSIGYRAYHVNGVSNTNSFMYTHGITWQRGLNGPTGSLAPAVSATTDAGEGGPPAQSGSESFANMLGTHGKCTFSVHLAVHAKHFNGGSRISGYDYHETASFALEQTSL